MRFPSRWHKACLAWTLVTLACLLAVETVVANEPLKSLQQADTLELESFQVTASRRPARILEVAEAVTLVDATRIMREAPGVLAEMLRGQAGTFFQQTTPGQGIPIIRGLKGSEVLHLVDGMRLNNAFFRNAPNQYLGLVDAYALDRMEVVRGAAPSLHGADAMGGVVQVLTAEPVFHGDLWQQALSAAAELTLSAQVLEQPSTPRIDELTAGFGQQQPSSEVYEFRPNRRSFLHARYRLYSQSRWFQSMEVHAARQVITDHRLTQDFADPIQVSESNTSTLEGLTMQFNTPWGEHNAGQQDLVWGWEYYTDTVTSVLS